MRYYKPPRRRASGTGEAILRSGLAVATHEVTLDEYLRFDPDHIQGPRAGFIAECPATRVSWYKATEYCNWLSKQDGIPDGEHCYLPNDRGEYAEGMKVKPSYLTLTGYRLPTEAEWRAARLAGVRTPYCCGEVDGELISNYAWWFANSFVDGVRGPSLLVG